MSRTRQNFMKHIIELEGFMFATEQWAADPQMKFIRQHVESCMEHLKMIINTLERLEQTDNKFWSALN